MNSYQKHINTVRSVMSPVVSIVIFGPAPCNFSRCCDQIHCTLFMRVPRVASGLCYLRARATMAFGKDFLCTHSGLIVVVNIRFPDYVTT